MAILANGVETLEFGVAWRAKMNANFNLFDSVTSITSVLAGYALATHDHDTVYEPDTTTITQTEIQSVLSDLQVDMKFTNNTESVTVIDTVTLSETRIFINNGVISTEVVV